MTGAHALADLTREDVLALAPRSTLVLPLGATEQHGAHLPLCVDTLVCERIALAAAGAAARESGPFLVAPALSYGRSDHHLAFAGTLSLRSATLLAVLADLLRSAAAWGIRSVFAVNGHGGNDAPMRVALADAVDELPLVVGGASYWTIAWSALAEEGAASLGRVPGHAGGFETSLVLALRPDLVRSVYRVGPEPQAAVEDPAATVVEAAYGRWGDGSGTSDDARAADAALGARLLERTERAVAQALAAFHSRAQRESRVV